MPKKLFAKDELTDANSLLLKVISTLTEEELEQWVKTSVDVRKDIRYYINKLDQETRERLDDRNWFESLPFVTWLSLLKYFRFNDRLEWKMVQQDVRVWTHPLFCKHSTWNLQFSHIYRDTWRQKFLTWEEMREDKQQAPKPCTVEVFARHPAHTFLGKLALWCLLHPFA